MTNDEIKIPKDDLMTSFVHEEVSDNVLKARLEAIAEAVSLKTKEALTGYTPALNNPPDLQEAAQ